MVDDKIFLLKINSNICLSIAIFLDFKKFVLNEFNYRHLIGNLIIFIMNVFNIIKFRVKYYYYIYHLSLFLACFSDFLEFISRFSSL